MQMVEMEMEMQMQMQMQMEMETEMEMEMEMEIEMEMEMELDIRSQERAEKAKRHTGKAEHFPPRTCIADNAEGPRFHLILSLSMTTTQARKDPFTLNLYGDESTGRPDYHESLIGFKATMFVTKTFWFFGAFDGIRHDDWRENE